MDSEVAGVPEEEEGEEHATTGARAKRWIDFDVDGRRIIEMFKGEDCDVEVKDDAADFHRATACLAVACIKIVISHEAGGEAPSS